MKPSKKVYDIYVNAPQNMFCVAAEDGYRIFRCNPLHQIIHIDKSITGSLRLGRFLNCSNFFGMVSGGSKPKFAQNVVMIWNDLKKKDGFYMEYTSTAPVINFQISNTRIVLVEMYKIAVFNFPKELECVKTIDTGKNTFGLCELSSDPLLELIVYPGHQTGTVQYLNLRKISRNATLTPKTIVAHRADIARMALNTSATLLATGSTKGTVIRLFNTRTGDPIREFRRGADPATLHCIRFSPCSSFLAVASDKDTVHVFAIGNDSIWTNRKTVWQQFGLIKDEADRSCIQFKLSKASQDATRTELAFVTGSKETVQKNPKGRFVVYSHDIVAICDDGSYNLFTFSSDGSYEMIRDEYYLNWGDDEHFFNQCLTE